VTERAMIGGGGAAAPPPKYATDRQNYTLFRQEGNGAAKSRLVQ
jgi:hypothetical protein